MSGLEKDSIDGTMLDIAKLDSISIVLGFIIVALFVRQVSLLIISITNMVLAIVISFGISYFFAINTDIASFGAAVQSAATVALTFDYSLFLFSKVKSELALDSDARTVIRKMLQSSGHVVLISGLCLALVFLLLVFCPVDMIQTIGITTFLTILFVEFIAITNTAAMLALFPKFFLKDNYDFWATDFLNCKRKKNADVDLDALSQKSGKSTESLNTMPTDVLGGETVIKEDNKEAVQKKTCCLWCKQNCTAQRNVPMNTSKFATWVKKVLNIMIHNKWVCAAGILIVVAVSCCFLYPMIQIKYSVDLSQLLPRTSGTLKAINRFGDLYGPGLIMPYYVVFNKTIPGQKDTLLNDEAFKLMGEMAETYISESEKYFAGDDAWMQLNKTQIIAPFFVNRSLDMQAINFIRKTANGSYDFLLKNVAPHPEDLSTFSMMITSDIAMTGLGSEKFIPFVRDIVDQYKDRFAELGIEITDYAYISAMIDAVNQLFASFPMVLGITAAVIFVIITLAFRSVLAPLRLLIEVLLIQVFYLGVNVCIFQYGHAMGDDSLLWATIFMMVMISIGLSCDYDIFSFNGIYRHYYDNYEQAIKNGVKINFTDSIMATGDNLLIVMCAGLIMMVSFSGLLFSSLDMLL